MKAIFVLLDSLNRNYLPVYGNDWLKAPNMQRLAEKGVVMDNHWLGSAPCMPARRDILTGRLNFLERGWGAIEPCDVPVTRLLRGAGIRSHMETDHYHYFHVGGENYHTQFDTYQFHRGQEEDPWQSRSHPPEEPEHLGRWTEQYDMNREQFTSADQYPTPKTFLGAVDWLQRHEDTDDYFLWVEGFDPHEPFDCPAEYVDQYEEGWDGPRYDWTGYRDVEGDESATRHLRHQYAGTVAMADEYLGKLIDELERQGSFDDTLIILTTDHGHLIGEHGVTGKNRWHVWNELGNLPMIAKLPGNRNAGQRRDQLTQNIDVMPTLLDYFGVPLEHKIHGESLRAVLEDDAPVQREAVLYGWFGMPVNVTDGKYTYMRASATEENTPLYMHCQIPTAYNFHEVPGWGMYREAEFGPFLPYTDMPVIRSRAKMRRTSIVKDTQLFDIESDPGQTINLAGAETDTEATYIDLLKRTMEKADAPISQFERLGLPV
jgi:arylsulfatase A-like enzyme